MTSVTEPFKTPATARAGRLKWKYLVIKTLLYEI